MDGYDDEHLLEPPPSPGKQKNVNENYSTA
jgi:hypothetical protein